MFQDIFPHKFDNQYVVAPPDADSYLVQMQGHSVLMRVVDQEIALPRYRELRAETLCITYLFSISQERFFLAQGILSDSVMDGLKTQGYAFHDIKLLHQCTPKWLSFAVATAYQLGSWYENNRLCGRCGGEMQKAEDERMLCCGNCKNMVYPKICPAVIVGVLHRDRILLTKYADPQLSEKYALIAGFAEIGETIEDVVLREVMEETGLHVKNLRYYKSQPWPFSDTLLFGFFCETDGVDTIVLDSHELSVAKWATQDEISQDPGNVSLTYEMMTLFQQRGRGVLSQTTNLKGIQL